MIFRPSADVGEVILSGEQSEKGQCEDACGGLIGAVFGARIVDLIENLGKMGKIVVHSKPCMKRYHFIRFAWRCVWKNLQKINLAHLVPPEHSTITIGYI